MSAPDRQLDQADSLCCVAGCGKRAIVLVCGEPLCAEHYIENVNELNALGLTPGNLAREEGPEPRPNGPVRVSEDVRGAARRPESSEK